MSNFLWERKKKKKTCWCSKPLKPLQLLLSMWVWLTFCSLCSKKTSEERRFFCLVIIKALEAIRIHRSLVAIYILKVWFFFLLLFAKVTLSAKQDVQQWCSITQKLWFFQWYIPFYQHSGLSWPFPKVVWRCFPYAGMQCKHVILFFFPETG